MNPVLERESRQRFRSRLMWLVITAWVTVVGLFSYLFFVIGREIQIDFFAPRGPLSGLNQAGQWVFEGMSLVLLTAIMFIVPAFTSLSIVGERERQTLSLVQVTQLTPFEIVRGKLYSSVGFTVVLMLAVIPLLAIPLTFGAVGPVEVLVAMFTLLLTLIMLTSVSIWVSSRARSNRGAVALSYLVAVAIFFGSFVMMGVEALIFGEDIEEDGRELVSTWVNPYVALADALAFPYDDEAGFFDGASLPTPMDPFKALAMLRQGEVEGLDFPGFRRIPVWTLTLLVYGLIIALSLWGASRRVTAPRPKPLRRRGGRSSDDPG